MQGQMAQLEEHLPDAGSLVTLDQTTLLELYCAALRLKRQPLVQSFRNEMRNLIARLTDQLRIDRLHSSRGNSPEALFDSLGGAAQSFLDAAVLAGNLPAYHGSKPMSQERRQRIERHVETLEHYLKSAANGPEFTLVHSGELPQESRPGQGDFVRDTDSLARALELFEASAESMEQVFRAVRAARLEASNAYIPEWHDEFFTHLNWQSLTADELNLLPPVAALESAEILGKNSLGSFSRLLHSGRPVHVLLNQDPFRSFMQQLTRPLEGFDPGWGYLSVAHREALVHHSALAEPQHLMQGLLRMAQSTCPAVTFVDGLPPANSQEQAWLWARAAWESRATTCYSYDPGAGQTWSTRFDLRNNPQPEKEWPTRQTPCHDADDLAPELEIGFTTAHWAALNPLCRSHFKVIPSAAWGPDQMEISEYLDQINSPPPRTVPFIWVIHKAGHLQRAVLTRALTLCCRDRLRHWRILQELAGFHNDYVMRAEASVRAKVEQEFEAVRKEQEAKHAAELARVRAETAGETIDRLAAALMNATAATPAATPGPPPSSPSPPSAVPGDDVSPSKPSANITGAAQEKTDGTAVVEGPSIDCELCTSCNECININPLLFKYNANKQACIADPRAGAFAQLVKAATKCPARCIHPGTPRPDDETVTDQLLALAAKFN